MDWSEVTETFETRSIVVADEAVEEGISLGVRDEEAMSGGALWLSADGFDDATVEAFDQAVGLRPIGFGQAMVDVVFGTDPIEGMAAGGSIARLVLHVDGEAVCELAAVVGQDGVQAMREVGDEAAEESCGGVGIAPWMDLQIDVARGAVDGHEGVAPAPLQGGQMLEIDVNEADGRLCSKTPTAGLSGCGRLLRPWRLRQRCIALRESLALTQRRITSVMSSSGNCSLVRSSQTSASSSADRLVVKVLGACERSLMVVRSRQRRIVVSLTPSSIARSATGLLLR